MDMDKYINWGIGALTAVGGVLGWCLGGWDKLLMAMVAFMVIDYATGLMVAGIFHASPKTPGGRLDSQIGWKGLARKACTLMIVGLAYMVDQIVGVDYIRAATIIGFMCNEAVSVFENAGHMGLKIPKPLLNAVEELFHKVEEQDAEAEDKREQEGIVGHTDKEE